MRQGCYRKKRRTWDEGLTQDCYGEGGRRDRLGTARDAVNAKGEVCRGCRSPRAQCSAPCSVLRYQE